MPNKDRKLLELAGFKVEARGELFLDQDGSRHYVDPEWTLSDDQALAERVADKVIEYDWCCTHHVDIFEPKDEWCRYEAYVRTPYVGDGFGDYVCTPIGFGSTRAEAITAMLYRWMEEQDVDV